MDNLVEPKTKVYAEFARYALTHNKFGAVRCFLYAKLFRTTPSVPIAEFIEFCKTQGVKQSTVYKNIQEAIKLGYLEQITKPSGEKALLVASMDNITKKYAKQYTEAFYIYLSDLVDERTLKGWLYSYAFVGLIGYNTTISRDKITEILGISGRTQQNYQKMFKEISSNSTLKVTANALETKITTDSFLTHGELVEITGKENVFSDWDNKLNKYIVYQVLPNQYIFEITEDRKAKSNYRHVKHKSFTNDKGNPPDDTSATDSSPSQKRWTGSKPDDYVFPVKKKESVGKKIRIFCESEKQARKLYQTEKHLVDNHIILEKLIFRMVKRVGITRYLPTPKRGSRVPRVRLVQTWRAY